MAIKRNRRPSRQETLRRLAHERRERMYRTYTPRRRDFRSPQQRIRDALKQAIKTTSWPAIC